MDIHTSELGFPGERDAEGYCGFYHIGTQYFLVEGTNVLIALRFQGDPAEVTVVAHRRQGREQALDTSCVADPFIRQAVDVLMSVEGVERVRLLPGPAVTAADPGKLRR